MYYLETSLLPSFHKFGTCIDVRCLHYRYSLVVSQKSKQKTKLQSKKELQVKVNNLNYNLNTV